MTRSPYHDHAWSVERLHRHLGTRLVTRLQAAMARGIAEERLRALLFDGAEPTHEERQTLNAWADRLEADDRTARDCASPDTRVTSRRIAFRIAVLRAGRTMQDVAHELGVSYNHLILVLDGKRVGSA